jgi:hypothetical protein
VFHNTKRKPLMEAISFETAPGLIPGRPAVTSHHPHHTETTMTKRKLLTEATGYADLPPEEVRRALVARFDDGYLKVDQAEGRVGVQGGWWYRGEYQLAPQGSGTRVTLRAYNVATRGRWAVPLANKLFAGFAQQTQARLDELLRALEHAA